MDWEVVHGNRSVPQQDNGSDCGVFTCIFANYYSQNLDLKFSSDHMPDFRQKIALDLSRGCADSTRT